MSRKSKPKSKQRRSGLQKPLDSGLSEDEARALLNTTSNPLQLFKALSTLGLCVAYGSWHNPTIKLLPAWLHRAKTEEEAQVAVE